VPRLGRIGAVQQLLLYDCVALTLLNLPLPVFCTMNHFLCEKINFDFDIIREYGHCHSRREIVSSDGSYCI